MGENAQAAGGLKKLVVKLTVGAEAPEKLSQAFTVASTAALSGFSVSLWLTGEASWLALPGRAESFELEGAAKLSDLLATLIASGSVILCTQCAGRRGITEANLITGIEIRGAASFVEEIMKSDTQALVY